MPLNRTEWAKTPYALSVAKDPDRAIGQLLDKYRITSRQFTLGTGPHGRRAVQLRFLYRERPYQITLEALATYPGHVDEEKLLRQLKRAIFFRLKTTLELALFWPLEEALFSHLELPDGRTVFESKEAVLAQIAAAKNLIALPPPENADGR